MNIPNDGGWGKPAGPVDLGSPEHAGGQGSRHIRHILALPHTWVFLGCLILTGSLFLGIGLIAARQNQTPKDPLWIEQLPPEVLPGSVATSLPAEQSGPNAPEAAPAPARRIVPAEQSAAAGAAVPQAKNYVASKTGTKYYLPGCATAKRIKDANKVWFATKAAAEAAGYKPASNCKGL